MRCQSSYVSITIIRNYVIIVNFDPKLFIDFVAHDAFRGDNTWLLFDDPSTAYEMACYCSFMSREAPKSLFNSVIHLVFVSERGLRAKVRFIFSLSASSISAL